MAKREVAHVCEDCGAAFVGSYTARFCPACRKKRQQANAKAVRRCVVCGKAFVGNARAKYCPECAKAAYMASDRQKSREWAEREKARRQRADAATGEDV